MSRGSGAVEDRGTAPEPQLVTRRDARPDALPPDVLGVRLHEPTDRLVGGLHLRRRAELDHFRAGHEDGNVTRFDVERVACLEDSSLSAKRQVCLL